MADKNPTVYSTELGRICPQCGLPISDCKCGKKKDHLPAGDGIVRIFRDSKSRRGKTVTLIKGILADEDTQKDILSALKRICGSGGALKGGVLEIQGDHRDVVAAELKKRGFTVKLAGG
jgi:translation initiation factor 1